MSDMGNDTESRKKKARKTALEFLRSSKERANDGKGGKGKNPERIHRELEPNDGANSSEGLTEAEEEDMQFVHLFFDIT